MVVYLITNIITGKYYVGQTTRDSQTRWSEHVKDSKENSQIRLHLSIRKYGEQNFKKETLCICSTQEELDKSEKFFIWFLGATKKSIGYNLDLGGKGGRKTEEVKQKISLTLRNRPVPQETRHKISKSLKGRKTGGFSDAHRKAISLAMCSKKRRPPSKECRKKISLTLTGRKFSEEHRQKLKDSWKIRRDKYKRTPGTSESLCL